MKRKIKIEKIQQSQILAICFRKFMTDKPTQKLTKKQKKGHK